MDCSKAREHLSAYLDNALDSFAKAGLEDHLSSCESCHSELNALRACIQAVASLERVQAPPDFLEKLHERIAETSPVRRFIERMLVPWRAKLPLHLAGAVAMALLIFLLHPGMRDGKEVPKTPEMAAPQTPAGRRVEPPSMQLAQEEPAQEKSDTAKPGSELADFKQSEKPIEFVLLIPSYHRAADRELKKSSEGAQRKEYREGQEARKTKAAGLSSEQSVQPRRSAAPAPRATAREASPRGTEMGAAVSAARPRGGDGQSGKSNDETADEAHTLARPAERTGIVKGRSRAERDGSEIASEIEDLIRGVRGTILERTYSQGDNLPSSILVSIPTASYAPLVAKLSAKGRLQDSARMVPDVSEDTMIHVRIKLAFTNGTPESP